MKFARWPTLLAAVLAPSVGLAFDPLRPLEPEEITAPTAAVQFYSGQQLRANCARGEGSEAACQGYLMGVVDGLEVSYDALGASQGTCLPDWLHSRPQEVRKIVVKYLDAHQEDLETGAGYLVADALLKAFPCPSR